MDMDGSLFRVKASITRKGGGSMHRKLAASVALSIAVMFCGMPETYAEDVWASSDKVTGEWGNVLVNDYVVTDSIQGDDSRFTVDVKHVGDISKNQISVQNYEFRQKDGLWCSYVKTSAHEAYIPIGTHDNGSIVSIFDICEQYSPFISLSDADIRAREAKSFFDKGTKLYFDDKDYPKSADCFTNAINLYPQYYDAYIRRARAYTGMHAYDKAIADYQYVIESGKDEYNIAARELRDVMKRKQGN